MESKENLSNKVVIVTGASSGIGEATARLLSSRGAKVILAGRRIQKLENIVSDIKSEGGEASYIRTNVSKQKEVQSLIDETISIYGSLDVLVNNAGFMSIAPIETNEIAKWDQMIDTNIKGVLYGIAAALPIFKKQNKGHFINIGSVAGIKVFHTGGTVYSATKFAVRAISEGLRQEVGEKIRTTTINPGMVDTELINATTHEESFAFLSEFSKIAISPQSIADSILFAIQQPKTVDLNEIVVRPIIQEF